MNKVKYVYNNKTCQYERARLSFREAIVYVVGQLATSVAFFVAMIFIYNYVMETDTERALRAENRAINKYKPILEQKLAQIQATLDGLDEKDKALYAQLFNGPPPVQPIVKETLPKDKVLLANASSFTKYLEILETKATYLHHHMANSNATF